MERFEPKPNCAQRYGLLIVAALLLLSGRIALPAFAQVSAGRSADPTDDLFTGTSVVRIQIEIPDEGMATLRKYNWEAKKAVAGSAWT